MTLRAINKYLDFQLRVEAQETLFQMTVGETLAGLAKVSYADAYRKVWGIKTEKKKEKTAEEVIEETFKKHKLTRKRGQE